MADEAALPANRRLHLWPAALVLLAALAIAALVEWEGRASREAIVAITATRAHERTTRLHLERLFSALKDIETGSRGYLLTGRADYLGPYEAARAAIPGLADEIARRKPELPPGTSWREVDELLGRRIALAATVVALRTALGARARGQSGLLDEGKKVMDRIREHFDAIDAAQDRRIAAKSRQVDDAMRRAERVSWAGSGVAFVLTLLAGALVLRERRQRSALEARLREANAALEGRVAERTRALAEARDRLAAFAVGQERAIEAERRRLAREVHDQIGQVFTAIRLIAGSLPRERFPPGQAQALDEALDMGIASTRRVTAALRPPLLDDLGFATALRHHAEGLAQAAGLALVVDIADDERLDETGRLALFRIAQEALTNVLRHAGARSVHIHGRGEGNRYLLRIADDGRGLAAAPRPGALGLAGMRERAELLGGDCEIAGWPGAGVTVTARLPLRHNGGGKPIAEDADETAAG